VLDNELCVLMNILIYTDPISNCPRQCRTALCMQCWNASAGAGVCYTSSDLLFFKFETDGPGGATASTANVHPLALKYYTSLQSRCKVQLFLISRLYIQAVLNRLQLDTRISNCMHTYILLQLAVCINIQTLTWRISPATLNPLIHSHILYFGAGSPIDIPEPFVTIQRGSVFSRCRDIPCALLHNSGRSHRYLSQFFLFFRFLINSSLLFSLTCNYYASDHDLVSRDYGLEPELYT
jgi:hypothetical protein